MKEGWEVKKLGDAIEIRNGRNQQQVLSQVGQYPILGSAGNVMGYSTDYICEAGTTIIGRKGNISKPIFINEKFWNVDTAFGFYPKNIKDLDCKFIYYLCLGIEFEKLNRGTTIPSLVKSELQQIEISLPKSISEQQRIVFILDEAFAVIDQAKENLQRNLQNAKELYKSYLQSVFVNKGEGWEVKTLGDIGKPSMCKRILKHQTSLTGDIPFYKIGTFGKTPDAFISKEIYNEFRTKYSFPKKGDILISASGTIGRRVRYDGEPAFFQDSNIVWIDNNEKQVLNDYLYVFYEFCDWQPSKGATISRLYNSNLTSIKIVFPKSIGEQEKILKKTNAVSTETKKIEAIYKQKINDLEELKKSVLHKAFSGQLKTNEVTV